MRSGSLCALRWRLLSWCHRRGIVLRACHIPGHLNVIADKLSRHNQVIQTESISAGVQSLVLKMGLAKCRPVCNLFQSQTPQVCFPVPDQRAWAVDALSLPWENLNAYAFPPVSLPGQVISKLMDQGLSQNDSDCSRVAQHALVLGPGQSIGSDPLQAPTAEGSGDTTLQRASQPETQQSESTCLAPRASAIQEQGFSDEVAARIEAPERLSTRAVYKSKWVIFVKWYKSNEVDFQSPSVNQIADFLLHLFKERAATQHHSRL